MIEHVQNIDDSSPILQEKRKVDVCGGLLFCFSSTISYESGGLGIK